MRSRRRDIQGLRAVAVVLVIANHFVGWPGGGFIGVDVFFVISGFLITGLLLREHQRTGRISFADFYRRRVKRILPAALLVTVTTLIVGYLVFTRARFEALLADGIWATLFGANWRFIATGTDYMHAGTAVSVLQHYWSLSIEEQFYFAWPLLLLAALTLGAPRRQRGAAVALALIGVASFGFALWESAATPTVAYFSTFSRVWELAAGALLAVAANRLSALPNRIRPFLAWGGVLLLAASAVFITPESTFPGPFALGPTVGAAAVIAAGIGGEVRYFWPLTNRVSSYLGDVSYSLYLWHLPVFVYLGVFLAATPHRYVALALFTTAALSVVTFHFVENPIRFGRGLVSFLRPAIAVAGILAIAVVGINVAPRESTALAQQPVLRENPTSALRDLWQGIDAALAQKTWPRLTPSIDTIGAEDKAPAWVSDGCLAHEPNALADPITNAQRCHFGNPDADKVAIVLGDSIAISWVPGIRAALGPLGYRIEVITSQECPAADVQTNYGDGSDMPECRKLRAWALSHIRELHPDLVIASSAASAILRLKSGATGHAAEREWQQGMHRTLSQLASSSRRVILLQGPPTSNGFDVCATIRSSPAACVLSRSPEYFLVDRANSAASAGLDVVYVKTTSWFCSAEGICPSFVRGTPVLADTSHLTADHSRHLAPVLAGAILGRTSS